MHFLATWCTGRFSVEAAEFLLNLLRADRVNLQANKERRWYWQSWSVALDTDKNWAQKTDSNFENCPRWNPFSPTVKKWNDKLWQRSWQINDSFLETSKTDCAGGKLWFSVSALALKQRSRHLISLAFGKEHFTHRLPSQGSFSLTEWEPFKTYLLGFVNVLLHPMN